MYHLVLPIAANILYYKYFDRIKTININKDALFVLSAIHNAGLSAFSLHIFIKMVTILLEHGIVFQSNYYYSIQEFNQLALYFYLSKYYEFADLALVILNKKDPSFLQKFHHIGAVYCWHLCYFYKVDAIWTANLINSLVHSVMYFYYLMSMFKIKYIKKIKVTITTLQISQLIASIVLCPYAYFPPVETKFKYGILLIFNSYVCALIALFLQFYVKTYGSFNEQK
jgi:hypothetical protein